MNVGLGQFVEAYRAPRYSCDTVKRAVRAIGWQQLCMGENPEADRAHFLRLYESMRSRYSEDRENEKVLALSGMGGCGGGVGREAEFQIKTARKSGPQQSGVSIAVIWLVLRSKLPGRFPSFGH